MTDEAEAGLVKSEALLHADALIAEAVKALRALTYADYLRTQHWLDFRESMLAPLVKCQQCGSQDRREVHHLTYDYLGRERASDVRVLCRRCHGEWHDEHAGERLSTSANDLAWAGRVRRFGQL